MQIYALIIPGLGVMDSLNKWLSVFANLGVLVGILFLAYEIQQNTTATNLETTSNFQNGFHAIELMIASDAEFAALLSKGRNGDSISDAEFVRLQALNSTVLRSWQTNLAQFRAGALDADTWTGTQALMAQRLREDQGLAAHWQENQSQFSKGFNSLVEPLIHAEPR